MSSEVGFIVGMLLGMGIMALGWNWSNAVMKQQTSPLKPPPPPPSLPEAAEELEYDTCDLCYHEGPDVHASVTRSSISLCAFCADTHAGNVAVYPEQYTPDQRWTAKMVAELYWKLNR